MDKGQALLLKSLADLRHSDDGEPDFGKVDSVDRSAFRESPCYRSFCKHRFERELGRAKVATGAKRVEMLRDISLNSSDDVAPEIHKEAAAALQAFDDSLPLSARIAWALGDDSAMAIISAWEPKRHFVPLPRGGGGGARFRHAGRCLLRRYLPRPGGRGG